MIGIKYVSFYRETSGFSRAAISYLMGLMNNSEPFTWAPLLPDPKNPYMLSAKPFSGTGVGHTELDPFCNLSIDYDTVVLHMLPELFPAWISAEPGKKHVGFVAWETDQIPAHWPHLLNDLDLLFVPSEWNKSVIEKGGVKVPIAVIPHVLPDWNLDLVTPQVETAKEDFMFYSIGAWTHRKAMYATLQSYLQAFSAVDPVVLVIKTGPQDLTKYSDKRLIGRYQRMIGTTERAVHRARKKHKSPARVVIMTDDLDETQLIELHVRGDCFVSLCRAEGWGLAAFEAAGVGNPVIMTGYGGQLDFLPSEHAYRVNYREVPAQTGTFERFFTPDQRWAEPDIDQGAELMRSVFQNQAEAKAKGRDLRQFVRGRFSEALVIGSMLAALNEL
jgi:glycosyltransferase involved in cell wall biosynthesis